MYGSANDGVFQVRMLLRARHYWEQEKYRLIAQKVSTHRSISYGKARQLTIFILDGGVRSYIYIYSRTM